MEPAQVAQQLQKIIEKKTAPPIKLQKAWMVAQDQKTAEGKGCTDANLVN